METQLVSTFTSSLLSFSTEFLTNKSKIESRLVAFFWESPRLPLHFTFFVFGFSVLFLNVEGLAGKWNQPSAKKTKQNKIKHCLFSTWWHSRDVKDTSNWYAICTSKQKQQNISICKELTCSILWNTTVWLCGHTHEKLTRPFIKPSSPNFFFFLKIQKFGTVFQNVEFFDQWWNYAVILTQLSFIHSFNHNCSDTSSLRITLFDRL